MQIQQNTESGAFHPHQSVETANFRCAPWSREAPTASGSGKRGNLAKWVAKGTPEQGGRSCTCCIVGRCIPWKI